MSHGPYHYCVLQGVSYLDGTYPEWWRRIDIRLVDMTSGTKHVLSLATGLHFYETAEAMFEPREWLVAHGFMYAPALAPAIVLTAEWHKQIARIRDERK